MRLQIGERLPQEAGVEQHVPVHEADERLPAVLKAELRTDPAARPDGGIELDHPDREGRGDADRPVAGAAVGQDDLAADPVERCHDAREGSPDPRFLVQCFENHRDRH